MYNNNINFSKISLNAVLAILILLYYGCASTKQRAYKKQNTITEKYWKLVALSGDQIHAEGTREAYIILKQHAKNIIGNGSCNTINGSYILKSKNGITFNGIISTEKACKTLATEVKFLEALKRADNYVLNADSLYLQSGDMMLLAKFEAVYLR